RVHQVAFEPLIDVRGADFYGVVVVDDLAIETHALVAGQCTGDRPHIDHDLDLVGRARLARLHFENRACPVARRDQIRAAAQGGRLPLQRERVLLLDGDQAARFLDLTSYPGDAGGMG